MEEPKELKSFKEVLFHKSIDVNIQPMIYTLRVLWEAVYGKDATHKENEQKGCGKKVYGGCPNLRICGEDDFLCEDCKENAPKEIKQ